MLLVFVHIHSCFFLLFHLFTLGPLGLALKTDLLHFSRSNDYEMGAGTLLVEVAFCTYIYPYLA